MKTHVQFHRRDLLALTGLAAGLAATHALARETPMSPTSTSAGLGGHRLQQVGLTVQSLARSVPFYRDVLGLPFLFEAGGMAFFDVAGTRLMIGEDPTRERMKPSSILYFDDPDLDTTGPKLEAHGVKFFGPTTVVQQTPTHELKLREFPDPDGNVLALMGLVARQG
jgi:predicted enzyme related to lactoylglutathione lyase